MHYRTLWISDVHLGASASRAADLLCFLDEVSADRIYLNGDIIDLERLRVRPHFPLRHRHLISRFIELANSGTEIIYIPGNHDCEFRDVVGREICGIRVMAEARHEGGDGKIHLVIHGDILDGRIRRGTGLEQFGAAAYNLLIEADVLINNVRNRMGRDYLSISAAIKSRLSSANEYIQRFENIAADFARERGFDGIVCGHIHRPCMRLIRGIHYANDGDWVEHRTALAETDDGSLRMLCWQSDAVAVATVPATPALEAA